MIRWLGPLLLLSAWEVAAVLTGDQELIPHLPEVGSAGVDLIVHERFHVDVVHTVSRALAGFFLAVLTGIPLGVSIGTVRPLDKAFWGVLEFGRSLPAFVLLPAILAITKDGEIARVGVVWYGSGVVLTAYAALGTKNVQRTRLEVAKLYGSGWSYRILVAARSALPTVLDGARVSLGLALILAMVVEVMLGATHGMGTRVNDSLAGFQLSIMYAQILIVGLVGWAMNSLAGIAARRIAPYGPFL